MLQMNTEFYVQSLQQTFSKCMQHQNSLWHGNQVIKCKAIQYHNWLEGEEDQRIIQAQYHILLEGVVLC